VKILLTGATGFIGSHVARALVRDRHEVQALVLPRSDYRRIEDIRSSLHFIEADLLSSSTIPRPASLDVCIHLAWYVEPGKYLEAPENQQWIEASLRLARTLKEAGCRRFVAAGTCFEYAPSHPPQQESAPTQPTTLYVKSKLALFQELQSIGIDCAWMRFFYQYGPDEDPRRFVPVVINHLLNGQEVKLVPGDRLRDFLYIEDVARAAISVAQSGLTGAVNIGSGVPVTVREIALKIGDLLGRPELIKPGTLPYSSNEPMDLLADNTRLRSTGWQPRVNLNDGLRETVAWWNSPQRPKRPARSAH